MILFQSPVFTPPTSGIATPVMEAKAPVPGGRRASYSIAGTSETIRIDSILEFLDFPLVCSLISHWFGFDV